MDDNLEKKLRTVLERRAKRYNLSVEELLSLHRKPLYLQSAERRAGARAISVEQLLSEELELMRSSEYPGPDCLMPHEVERYLTNDGLANDRLEHLRDCASCQSLLAAAAPSDEWIAEATEVALQLVNAAVAQRVAASNAASPP
jgi:hypothetical protein